MNIQKITFSPRLYNRASRIYIFVSGESLLENLNERRSRPYTAYRKEVLPKLFELLGLDVKDFDLGWSQKAGCSCPCSPGFVDKSRRLRHDIFVDISDEAVTFPEIAGTIPKTDERVAW